MKSLWMIPAAAFCWAGCSLATDPDELEQHAQAPLTNLGANIPVTPSPNSPQGNETSATWALFANNTPGLLISYNSQAAAPWPDGTRTHCAWTRSANSGVSWISTDDHATPLPGYGAGSNGSLYRYCLGDTYVAASGYPGVVAMVAAARNQDSGLDIALWTTPDIGASWKNVARVSDKATAGANNIDGPKIAFDTVNHTAWVWWWSADHIDGTGPHNWLRPVKVDPTGTMTPLPAVEVTSKLKVFAPEQAAIAVKNPTTVGGQPTIYLAYASAGTDSYGACQMPANWASISVDWWLSVSTDGGTSFTSYPIDTDPHWPRCIDASKFGGNRSSVSMAYDPDSQRVVLAYDRHMDDAGGRYVGTRVITKQWPDAGGGTDFDTWIPSCNPAVCPDKKSSCLVNVIFTRFRGHPEWRENAQGVFDGEATDTTGPTLVQPRVQGRGGSAVQGRRPDDRPSSEGLGPDRDRAA